MNYWEKHTDNLTQLSNFYEYELIVINLEWDCISVGSWKKTDGSIKMGNCRKV